MENEMQVEAFPRKFWSVMRFFFFMLRKGISKRKLSLQLNLMLKRSKITGKSVGNIHSAAIFSFYKAAESRRSEQEFSCNNTPTHHKFAFKKKQHRVHEEARCKAIEEDFMEMMGQNDAVHAPSPVLSGLDWFKPIRVTDSPFPVFSGRVKNGDCHVDEAADEFIKKFYNQLRRQALTDG